jgi:hypothetical protein
MAIEGFSHAEKLAFIGLARLMIRADNEMSEEEAQSLGHLAREIGEDEFWQLTEEAGATEAAEIKRLAESISRVEAQEIIYGNLFELAQGGSILPDEAKLLDWLAEIWRLDISDVAGEEE